MAKRSSSKSLNFQFFNNFAFSYKSQLNSYTPAEEQTLWLANYFMAKSFFQEDQLVKSLKET